MQVYPFKSASELRVPFFFHQNLNVRNCVHLILPGARFYSTDRSCTSFKTIHRSTWQANAKKPKQKKKKNVEIKQRNSSIWSVYLSKRLALGFPIQQSLESLGAKMLLL